MRIVTTQSFCKVCIEGLWHALLRRVNLIDGTSTTCELLEDGTTERLISVDLLRLAHLREENIELEESYAIEWTRNGEPLRHLSNFTEVAVDDAPATYGVEVRYATEEVRADPHGYLRSSIEISVMGCKNGN